MTKKRRPAKNPAAQTLAKLSVAAGGPSIGGKARAAKLSAKERREAARKAVQARWKAWRTRRTQARG